MKRKPTKEKKTNKYLVILEADTIKQLEMKEKLRKSVSWESVSYLKQNYEVETLPKEWIPGLFPLYDIRDHSWNGPEKNLRYYIQEMTMTDYMYQEKKKEENLTECKTTLTHQYNNTKIT